MLAPAPSNAAGTALGTIAGGLTVGWLSNAAFVATLGVSIGMTPVAIAGVAGVAVTALVNYLVDHYADVKGLNDVVALIPKFYPQFPNDPRYPVVKTNFGTEQPPQ